MLFIFFFPLQRLPNNIRTLRRFFLFLLNMYTYYHYLNVQLKFIE